MNHRDMDRARLGVAFLRGARLRTDVVRARFYGAVSDASFHKTFKRDREALAAQGIYLEPRGVGSERTWALDRTRSLADETPSVDTDARALAALLGTLCAELPPREASELGGAAARLGRAMASETMAGGPLCNRHALEVISTSERTRRPCELSYRAKGESVATRRVFRPYGLFILSDITYAVGLRSRDGVADAVRTLNLCRVSAAHVRNDLARYDVPKDFDIDAFRVLSFEIGDDSQVTARLHIPEASAGAFRARRRQRGRLLRNEDGSLEWDVEVRDLAGAASWAADIGAVPLRPPALVSIWKTLLEEGADA